MTNTTALQLRIDRTRMAMNGNWYAYDAAVPASQVDCSKISYFIVRDGEKFVTLTDATRPAELDAMPRGVARYDAFIAHDAACKETIGRAIQSVFPETLVVAPSEVVQSMVNLPEFNGSHETRFSEVA